MGEIKVGERVVELSNEDKILFPQDGITKRNLVDYYLSVAEHMLPHIQDRPTTLHRFPDGIDNEGFLQKSASDYFPDWIERCRVKVDDTGEQEQVLCQNPGTLAYLANQGTITFHTRLSRRDRLNYPDKMIFDLDPATGDFLTIRGAATALHTFLDEELGLTAFLMTTGSSGVHVVVPLDGSGDFDEVRGFARDVAAVLESRYPAVFTTEHKVMERVAPVFIDTARNAYGQTAVAPYSVRATNGAPVAMPLSWEELSNLQDSRQWSLENVPKRLSECGDAWVNLEKQACSLDEAKDLLAAAISQVALKEDNVGGIGR